MNYRFQATNPEDILMTMTITMSIGEWKKLRDELDSSKFPAVHLSNKIRDMVQQASAHFYPEEGE